ncbi:hypothetical protein B0J18DRAFT_461954 [Chaetomium sp. MPI-SDFR-AT-0129]|nr:hypothetical protein B0J18DRAFT_461954 [Chaetomium sp. MPI-SDFR-AT-0129]
MADSADDMDEEVQPETLSPKTYHPAQAKSENSTSTENPPSKSKTASTRNAFTELMAPKPKAPVSQQPQSLANKASQVIRGRWRGALVEYIDHPERFPNEVLRVTTNTVLIKDAFPKATVHLLLLPRSPAHYLLHPHTAFMDKEFLAMMREEAAVGVRLATAELSRRLGSFSATNRARDAALNHLNDVSAGDDDTGEAKPIEELPLPTARDYESEILVGTHAHPSMAHLHVHIVSRDMHSDRMRHRKHYNSFTTPFLVPLADQPLAADDARRETGYQNANLGRELVCWRCGRVFGNKFAELKKHLETEFVRWREE